MKWYAFHNLIKINFWFIFLGIWIKRKVWIHMEVIIAQECQPLRDDWFKAYLRYLGLINEQLEVCFYNVLSSATLWNSITFTTKMVMQSNDQPPKPPMLSDLRHYCRFQRSFPAWIHTRNLFSGKTFQCQKRS